MHERLTARGFGGRMGFGERPAVLVRRPHPRVHRRALPLASNLDAQVANTRRILEAARAAGAPVILSTVSYDAGLEEAGRWQLKVPNNEWLVEGSEWVEVDERLERQPGDMLLVKKYASCFFGTDLVSRLTSRGVDTPDHHRLHDERVCPRERCRRLLLRPAHDRGRGRRGRPRAALAHDLAVRHRREVRRRHDDRRRRDAPRAARDVMPA